MVGHAINSAFPKRASSRKVSRKVAIPLETIKHGDRMDPQERLFLEAVEKGDKHTVVRCLTGENNLFSFVCVCFACVLKIVQSLTPVTFLEFVLI